MNPVVVKVLLTTSSDRTFSKSVTKALIVVATAAATMSAKPIDKWTIACFSVSKYARIAIQTMVSPANASPAVVARYSTSTKFMYGSNRSGGAC